MHLYFHLSLLQSPCTIPSCPSRARDLRFIRFCLVFEINQIPVVGHRSHHYSLVFASRHTISRTLPDPGNYIVGITAGGTRRSNSSRTPSSHLPRFRSQRSHKYPQRSGRFFLTTMNPILEETALPTTSSNPDVEPVYVLGRPISQRLERMRYEYDDEQSVDGGWEDNRSLASQPSRDGQSCSSIHLNRQDS